MPKSILPLSLSLHSALTSPCGPFKACLGISSRTKRNQFSSVAQSCPTLCDPMDCSTPGFPVYHQLLEPAQTMSIESVMPSNHLISSVIPFSSHLQSFPATGSFQMKRFFSPGGLSVGVSTSTSVLLMSIQDWFPLGWTSWFSLQSKGLSRVFSNTTAEKHQFFDAQPSLWSNSHIHAWLLEKP